jgi:glycosyltransferase involved in cell wall biosynthesis
MGLEISIVIPTRNRARVLKRALDSAVNQTLPAAEIIVADNNSTDETKEVIDSFNDSRIVHLLTDEDIPMMPNWIRGIKASRGEWVKILPDDDWIENEFLEKTAAEITDNRVMIHTGGIVHNSNGTENYDLESINSDQPFQQVFMKELKGTVLATLIKRSALDYAIEVLPELDPMCLESGLGSDLVLIAAATTQPDNSWVHIPEPLVHYECREGSVTIQVNNENPGFVNKCYQAAKSFLDTLEIRTTDHA